MYMYCYERTIVNNNHSFTSNCCVTPTKLAECCRIQQLEKLRENYAAQSQRIRDNYQYQLERLRENTRTAERGEEEQEAETERGEGEQVEEGQGDEADGKALSDNIAGNARHQKTKCLKFYILE